MATRQTVMGDRRAERRSEVATLSKPNQYEATRPMGGDCLRCTATFTNGALIGMVRTGEMQQILWALKRGSSVCFAVEVGMIVPDTVDRHIVMETRQTSAVVVLDFV